MARTVIRLNRRRHPGFDKEEAFSMAAAALSMVGPRPAPPGAGEAEEGSAASPDPTDSWRYSSGSLAGSELGSQPPAGSAPPSSPSLVTGLRHGGAPVAASSRTSRHSFDDSANLSERERALLSEATKHVIVPSAPQPGPGDPCSGPPMGRCIAAVRPSESRRP